LTIQLVDRGAGCVSRGGRQSQQDAGGQTKGWVHGASISVLVYPSMKDETIGSTLYRTGRGDRVIPATLAVILVAAAGLAAASGPWWWPWGVSTMALCLAGAGVATARWYSALESVRWDEGTASLVFSRGRTQVFVPWAALTSVDSRPSSVRTLLAVGRQRYRLSHRLVRIGELLDHLRVQRPDLFPAPAGTVVLRRSAVPALFQLAYAGGTALTGLLLSTWWTPWGPLLGLAGVYIVFRVGFFIPRRYEVGHESLVVRYWLRRRRWGRPDSVRQDAYAAGGAVFSVLEIRYGADRVVLDEGQLVDALRPWSEALIHRLVPPRPEAVGQSASVSVY